MFVALANQTLTHIKSLLSFRSKSEGVLDFKCFYDLMHLDDLNLTDQEKIHVASLYDQVKFSDHSKEVSQSWEALIGWIDYKVTEKNFHEFEVNLQLSSQELKDGVHQKIRRLYFLTDHYALSGRIIEAKETWKLLMSLMKYELKDFEEKPLNAFDGGIPRFS